MNKSNSDVLFGAGCFALIVFTVIAIPFDAFTIKCFWNWYVVPFTGFQAMTMAGAFGLCAIVGIFRSAAKSNNTSEVKSRNEVLGEGLISLLGRFAIA